MFLGRRTIRMTISFPAIAITFCAIDLFVCFICRARVQVALSGGDASRDLRLVLLLIRRILATDAPIIVPVKVNEQGPRRGVLVLTTVGLTQPRFPRFDEQLAHVRKATYGEDAEQAAAHDNHCDRPRGYVTAARRPGLAGRPRPPIHARAAPENARTVSTAVIQCRAVHLFSSDTHPAAAGRAHRHIMTTRRYPLLIKPYKRSTIIISTTRDSRRRLDAITRLETRKFAGGLHQ